MAAGQGFKTFTTGEVLTAGDVNGYLMQGINVFANATARDAAITAPAEGQFAFTKDNNSLWYYDGAAWVASGATGDIEGVSVTSPITGGGTSGTVTIGIDSTAVVPSQTGNAGKYLTTNGTASSWATVSAWSPNLTLLNTGGTALTGAGTITVNVASYDSYFIFCDTASSSNASAFCRIRFNGDTASNYGYVNVGSQGTNVFNQINVSSIINIMKMDTSAGSNYSFMASVIGGKTTGLKMVSATSTAGTGSGAESLATTAYWNGGAAITSISLIASTGNFDNGTVYVYGG